MTKAVFLDRDGVINSDEGLYYIYNLPDLKLNSGIPENILRLKQNGYMVIVISNQGGIGKGLYSKSDTDAIHDEIALQVRKCGAEIDAFYYCPHHPDTGKCFCRKPQSLLIDKAIARYHINPAQSFLIGDSPRDVEAAENAGVRGFLVPKNSNIEPWISQILSND